MIIIKDAETKKELTRVQSYAAWHRAQQYRYRTVNSNGNIKYVTLDKRPLVKELR